MSRIARARLSLLGSLGLTLAGCPAPPGGRGSSRPAAGSHDQPATARVPARHPVTPAAATQRRRGLALGTVRASAVLALSPAWQARFDVYRPDPAVLGRLRRRLRRGRGPLRIAAFFGAWCGDSVAHVPPLLKVLRGLGTLAPGVTWIAVDRRKEEPQGRAGRFRIVRVPTFVVLRGQRELGRIVETPRISVEADLLAALGPP